MDLVGRSRTVPLRSPTTASALLDARFPPSGEGTVEPELWGLTWHRIRNPSAINGETLEKLVELRCSPAFRTLVTQGRVLRPSYVKLDGHTWYSVGRNRPCHGKVYAETVEWRVGYDDPLGPYLTHPHPLPDLQYDDYVHVDGLYYTPAYAALWRTFRTNASCV